MEQETTETDSEQKNKQGNTTLEQNAETVSNTVAKGIHANIYKVELGHNTNVLDQTTGKVETIDKGSIITIYATAVAFEFVSFSSLMPLSTIYYKQRLTVV